MIRKVTSGLAKLLAAGDHDKLSAQLDVQEADVTAKIKEAQETIDEQRLVMDVVAGFRDQASPGPKPTSAAKPATPAKPAKPATVTSNLPPGQ